MHMKFALLVVASMLCSCSLLRDACAQSAADRASAAILIDDAQDKLDRASLVIASLPEDSKAKGEGALQSARVALDAARHVLAGSRNACEGANTAAAFAEFASAWQALAPFLSLMGGAHSGAVVPTPMVLR